MQDIIVQAMAKRILCIMNEATLACFKEAVRFKNHPYFGNYNQ